VSSNAYAPLADNRAGSTRVFVIAGRAIGPNQGEAWTPESSSFRNVAEEIMERLGEIPVGFCWRFGQSP